MMQSHEVIHQMRTHDQIQDTTSYHDEITFSPPIKCWSIFITRDITQCDLSDELQVFPYDSTILVLVQLSTLPYRAWYHK